MAVDVGRRAGAAPPTGSTVAPTNGSSSSAPTTVPVTVRDWAAADAASAKTAMNNSNSFFIIG